VYFSEAMPRTPHDGHGTLICHCCLQRQEMRNLSRSKLKQKEKSQCFGANFYFILKVIFEKENLGEQRFGILPACSHCFCLTCIRTWRQARHFETRVYRTCPECRVPSDFVCPSRFWMSTKEEKERLLRDYKKAMR
jgi:E3 ubiquitin-protein ligase makorin